MSRKPSLTAASAAVVVAVGLAGSVAAPARAGVVPTFAQSAGSFVHSSGVPDDPAERDAVSIGDGRFPSDLSLSTMSLPGGGSTVARGGMLRTADANSIRIAFAPGTGVSQTDPTHAAGPSTLQINFEATWTITGGTFGPPIGMGFSVPIGLNIGPGGSGGFSAAVAWDATVDDTTYANVREPFVVQRGFGPGKLLTSITAPASTSLLGSLTGSPGSPATVTIRGNVVFAADNDGGPSSIEFPTYADFGDMPNWDDYAYTPGASMWEETIPVPEPTAAGLLGAAAVGGLIARRRRRRRPEPVI